MRAGSIMFEHFIEKGLIETEELKPLLGRRDVIILDASYVLPNSGGDPKTVFQNKRISGARYFDIDAVRDCASDLPHMLPSQEGFAHAASWLGIENSSFVVVYGQGDMAMGPARLWWMMRVFGHDAVAVLNGGLRAWEASGYMFEQGPTAAVTQTNYKISAYHPELVLDMAAMQQISKSGACPILDARPKPRFDGAQPEPRPGLRSGHIPGSFNVPAGSLSDPQSGKIRSEAELKALFGPATLEARDVALTCGSGVTACMLALGLFTMGQHKAMVYDGSWAEWGAQESGQAVSTTNQ